MTDRGWYHDTGWDEATMAEFERRLSRARPASRPGYLRVKAATLLETHDATARHVAIGLLHRVADDYDNFLEVPWSHELLGEAYRRDRDLTASERHYRLCLDTMDERRNGTSGVTELRLAEVLIEQGRIGDAVELLDDDELRSRLRFRSNIFRYAVAVARCEASRGGDPKPWAQQALELAGDRSPQFPRHPTVGIPDPDPATIAEMERLAASA